MGCAKRFGIAIVAAYGSFKDVFDHLGWAFWLPPDVPGGGMTGGASRSGRRRRHDGLIASRRGRDHAPGMRELISKRILIRRTICAQLTGGAEEPPPGGTGRVCCGASGVEGLCAPAEIATSPVVSNAAIVNAIASFGFVMANPQIHAM
jgi:hypothetical protein